MREVYIQDNMYETYIREEHIRELYKRKGELYKGFQGGLGRRFLVLWMLLLSGVNENATRMGYAQSDTQKSTVFTDALPQRRWKKCNQHGLDT